MLKRMLQILLLVYAVCGCSTLAAAVSWDRTSATVEADLLTNASKADYQFTVTGDTIVQLTLKATSCGCTTAGLDKRYWRPGESGTITVGFDYGSRTGNQTKTVEVVEEYIGGEEHTTVLSLSVSIPEPITIVPALVTWRADETRDVKHIRISSQEPGLKITAITQDNPALRVAYSQEPDGSYRVSIRPEAAFAGRGTVTIFTNSTMRRYKAIKVYAVVRGINGIAVQENDNEATSDAALPHLTWDTTTHSCEVNIDSRYLTRTYMATNEGDQDITIRSILLDDGQTCTVGPGIVIGPNQQLPFLVTIPITSTGELVVSRIFVRYANADRHANTTVLELKHRAPWVIATDTTAVFWQPSQHIPETRLVSISLRDGQNCSILGIEGADSAGIQASFIKEDGSTWSAVADHDFPAAIKLTPVDPLAEGVRKVYVLTDHEVPRYRRIPFPVIVH